LVKFKEGGGREEVLVSLLAVVVAVLVEGALVEVDHRVGALLLQLHLVLVQVAGLAGLSEGTLVLRELEVVVNQVQLSLVLDVLLKSF
jgi:hypothetical protein